MLSIYLMGEGGVGKSAVTLRYITNNFIEYYDPTIEDQYRTKILVDNKLSNINIVDTAGQEEYVSIRNNWIRDGDGFILVYSITDRNSFEEIKILMDEIIMIKGDKSAIMLVGNKNDLNEERQVTFKEVEELSDKWNCKFHETSAKTGHNINETFFQIVREIRKKKIYLELKEEEDKKKKKKSKKR